MVAVPEKFRRDLKKPLGKLYKDVEGIRALRKAGRIVSVGDMCTIALLKIGITPHLAVFDYRCKRKRLGNADRSFLMKAFKKKARYSNPAGTLSDKLLLDAPALMEKGGAIFIAGEDDLTTLAFILAGKDSDIVLYGQPNKGIVIVKPTKKLKRKIVLSLLLL